VFAVRLAAVLLAAAGLMCWVGDVAAQNKGDKGGFAKKGGPPLNDAPAPDAFYDWIDVHVHLRIPPNGTPGAAASRAAQAMADGRIQKMVLEPQPFPDPDSGGRTVYDYDALVGPVRASGGKFAFLGGNRLNQMIASTPADGVTAAVRADFEREAEKVLAAGAAGFGEFGLTHLSRTPGHPFENVAADHPLMLALADIAGKSGKLIDIHMDLFDRDAATPANFKGSNPPRIARNTEALERLLGHNRNARMVLAHFGSDITGQWSNEVARGLLSRNSNLYMSIKLSTIFPGTNQPFTPGGGVRGDWIQLLSDFPDRFVIGTDSFFTPPGNNNTDFNPKPIQAFLAGLPEALRTKIAVENAKRLYGLN
jgi:predicted TIM-barrel fold metal-dependent hydrolase